MMRLPPFDLARPSTLEEATALLAEPGARPLAGGTDLLVNLKHHLYDAPRLVALGGLEALRGISLDGDGALVIGAGETLAAVASSPLVRERAAALAEAAGLVAHPQARTMGTLGGNVCLDVRCRWVNRTPFWRGALGGCLKSEGDRCHVVPKGRACVAALCGDTVPALCALDAEAEIAGPGGTRRVPVEALRGKDGRDPLTLARGEILVALRLPPPAPHRRSAYRKWAVRGAVDFPLVSVALSAEVKDETLRDLRVVVGVLGPRPRRITRLSDLDGRPLDEALIREVSQRVCRQATPLPNVLHEPEHRRRVLGALVRRQLAAWAGNATS
jgi:4-hydroxybenzoyl-CoA reductase subunit beta